MDASMIWIVLLFVLIFAAVAVLLSPPTFISDLFDGDRKRKKGKDWTEED